MADQKPSTSPNTQDGIGNTTLYERKNKFEYNYSESETVFKGQNNTWMVFGRDRPSGSFSGYGGQGAEKCGAIDIVVGRLSSLNSNDFSDVKINSNVGGDAARIYISQRADIDDYYKICDGYTGKSRNKSAIALKADDIRIIGRNSIKLVTRTDDHDSNKQWIGNKAGVQLIANNDAKIADMQPIPKGINLENCLFELTARMHELAGQIKELMIIQKRFNAALSNHRHLIKIGTSFETLQTSDGYSAADNQPLPFIGKSTDLQLYSNVEQQINFIANNLESVATTYLTATSKKYINSKYHKLN